MFTKVLVANRGEIAVRVIRALDELGIASEAVHPGYGFLAENAPFVRRLEEAGITFIGPPAAAIEAMGSKTRARELMSNAGVPIVPGTTDALESVEDARTVAEEIGYPVAVKAAGGG